MINHTDVQIVESLYKAFKDKDKDKDSLNELIADDCQWEVGGNHGLSGTRGKARRPSGSTCRP